jgi:hypothetical protein
MSQHGDRIAAGTADGRLQLFDSHGKRLWAVGGPQVNTNTFPNSYLSGAFAASGKTMVVATKGEAQHVALVDGKILSRLAGANGGLGWIVLEQEALFTDGQSVIRWSLDDGRVLSRLPMPGARVVGLGLGESPDALVVATEADGAVRLLTTVPGGQNAVRSWEHRQPRRLVKMMFHNYTFTALAYWGGLVEFLWKGDVVLSHSFEQDVSALVWHGGEVVVGLADGQVIALKPRPPR